MGKSEPSTLRLRNHWVNRVVSREEELQSGSGVNADGATGHAAQSKQNKLWGEGLALVGIPASLDLAFPWAAAVMGMGSRLLRTSWLAAGL